MRKGFTLIELLVVVLIIGILAAFSVPQYMKTVEKSRAAEAFTNLKALATASEIYYLAHDKYPTDFSGLDLDFGDSCTAQNCMHGYYYFRFTDSPSGAVVAYIEKGFEGVGVSLRPYIGYVLFEEGWEGNTKKGDFVCQSRGIEKWDDICVVLGGTKSTGNYYILK